MRSQELLSWANPSTLTYKRARNALHIITQMKATVIREPGGPEVLSIEPWPVPEPAPSPFVQSRRGYYGLIHVHAGVRLIALPSRPGIGIRCSFASRLLGSTDPSYLCDAGCRRASRFQGCSALKPMDWLRRHRAASSGMAKSWQRQWAVWDGSSMLATRSTFRCTGPGSENGTSMGDARRTPKMLQTAFVAPRLA